MHGRCHDLEWIIKSVIILLSMTAGFAYLTLFERKVLARIQVRIGPNRAGPFGLLQPVADADQADLQRGADPGQRR